MNPDTTVRSMYTRPEALGDIVTHYCPGCTHGIAHRLIAEVVEEMTLREKVIGVASVGCSVFAYNYFTCDFVEAAHGRAPAMATGIKRLLPDRLVFTYQGDGDLASIGMAEIVHAAARGENISVFFINNANYGMTGGQMAPTTLPGQRTTSSPAGRNVAETGFPIHTAEMLATLDGPSFIARQSLHDPLHVRKAKKAIRTSVESQLRGLGFSLVELLSSCPTNWKMTPIESLKFIEDEMIPVYPLGEFKRIPALDKAGVR
jgi:2-oxoglutarate ferredoxin oxidoreductase subunit beta